MFQSRSLTSSPGTYLRCSLNSTEKPWKGLACRPARKPSTMNLARRSSRETWRITSGRRYCSTPAMNPSYSGKSNGERGFLDALFGGDHAVRDVDDAVADGGRQRVVRHHHDRAFALFGQF